MSATVTPTTPTTSTTVSATGSGQAPAPRTMRQMLRERPALRYVLTGIVLLIVAVPQMFVGRTPASSGHYILAGIGLLLIAVGAVSRTVGNRR